MTTRGLDEGRAALPIDGDRQGKLDLPGLVKPYPGLERSSIPPARWRRGVRIGLIVVSAALLWVLVFALASLF